MCLTPIRRTPIRRRLGSLLLAGLLAGATGPAQADGDAPRRFALLIGCTEYPFLERKVTPEVYASTVRLRGPANDVALLGRVLRERLSVAAERITTLTGWSDDSPLKNPDRANILRSLVRLSRQVAPGDEVFVFFAGHGSRQPDLDGDEPDGMDEVLLPADVQTWSTGERRIPGAITDDEIHAKVSAIRDAGAKVVLLFDCCHAGTLARGGEPGWRSRSLAPDLLGVPATERPAPTARRPSIAAPAPDLRGIVALYACAPGEKAPERPLPKADPAAPWQGLLTWAIAAALEGPHPPATWRDLLVRVRHLYLAFPWQGATPAVEGDVLREIRATASGPDATPWAVAAEPLTVAWTAPPGAPAAGAPALEAALRRATEGQGIRVAAKVEEADWVLVQDAERVLVRPAGLSSGPDAAFETDVEHLGAVLAQIARGQGLTRLALSGAVPALGGRVRAEIRRLDVEGEPLLEPGGSLTPGDRVRITVENVSDVPQDVWVFALDGAFGLTCVWPDPTTSPRMAPRAGPVVFETTVTDETLGTEHLLVAAFPARTDQPPVNLRWLEMPPLEASTLAAHPRGSAEGGRVEDLLLGAAFPGGATLTSRAPGPRASEGALGLLTWRTTWEPLPRPATEQKAVAPGIAVEIRPDGRTASYDTDGDGTFDLVLEDVDEDPEADVRRTRRGDAWSVEKGVNVPWLRVALVPFEDPAEYARAVLTLRSMLR